MNRYCSRLMFVVLVCFIAVGLALGQGHGEEVVPAIEGLDPVLLVQGKEVPGNLKISVTRGRFEYFFANEDDKTTFQKQPEQYEIQLNGSCARMGAPVGGNPDLYTVHKGRIYIFGSPECKSRFEAAPEKYLEADNGPKPMAAMAPEAVNKARELIEKAVTAMGGANTIDNLTDYQEKSVSSQTRRGTDVEVKSNLAVIFPDRIRVEQIAPDFVNPTVMRQNAFVMNGSEAFVVTAAGSRSVPDTSRFDQQRELDRRPLAILRARKLSTFKAAAAGSTKIGDASVEQVLIEINGAAQTIGIDPATGRIVSLSYRRRGPGGDFGEVVKTFSDFRTVGGLTGPFKVTATFNGEPWKEQSATIESIAVNSKLDTALFSQPKGQ